MRTLNDKLKFILKEEAPDLSNINYQIYDVDKIETLNKESSYRLCLTQQINLDRILDLLIHFNGQGIISCHSFNPKAMMEFCDLANQNSTLLFSEQEKLFVDTPINQLIDIKVESDSLNSTLLNIQNALEKHRTLTRFSDRIISISKEILDNAFTQHKEAKQTAPVSFKILQSADSLAIFAIDQCGSMDIKGVTSLITRQVKRNAEGRLDPSKRGMGLFLTLQNSSSLILANHQNERACVGAILPLTTDPILQDLYAKNLMTFESST